MGTTRRRVLQAIPVTAAVWIGGCADPALVHQLQADSLRVSRVETGWRLAMELEWELEQEGMMTGNGVGGPEVVAFDDARRPIARKPVELPLVAYEDCAYANGGTDREDDDATGDDRGADAGTEDDRGDDGDTGTDRTPANGEGERPTDPRGEAGSTGEDCPLGMPKTGETTTVVLETGGFPHLISFAFERVDTEVEVTVYGYVGSRPPPDTVWLDRWEAVVIDYPRDSDDAPLP